MAYPVTFDVAPPEKMARVHVVLRLLIVVIASSVTGNFGGLGLVYLFFPVAAAVLVSQKDGPRYLAEDGERVTRWVAFVVGVLAYIAMLTDELPGGGRTPVRVEIQRSGTPTAGSALLRILYAIPSALVLALIGIASWVVWIIAAISVLISESYPEGLWRFQRGVVRWEARLLGYIASLVEPYPPFSFDTGPAA
jgi:hypothetical protein